MASNRSICQAVLSVAKRLTEAGYPVTGPDAIPFQSCALKFSRELMEYGVTTTAFLAVASKCKEEPPCLTELPLYTVGLSK